MGEFAPDAISFVPIEQIRKLLYYYEELKALHDVPGDLVEFGVWRASTLCFLSDANLVLDGPNSSRTIIGFDTFAGFPPDEPSTRARDSECRHLFADTSLDVVQRKIESRPGRRLRIVPGHIAETLPRHIETWANRIAMAICDADTAEVTRIILDGIWDRMAPGGRIYFDEYSRDGWSETDGVDAFLRDRGLPLRLVRRAKNGVPGVPSRTCRSTELTQAHLRDNLPRAVLVGVFGQHAGPGAPGELARLVLVGQVVGGLLRGPPRRSKVTISSPGAKNAARSFLGSERQKPPQAATSKGRQVTPSTWYVVDCRFTTIFAAL